MQRCTALARDSQARHAFTAIAPEQETNQSEAGGTSWDSRAVAAASTHTACVSVAAELQRAQVGHVTSACSHTTGARARPATLRMQDCSGAVLLPRRRDSSRPLSARRPLWLAFTRSGQAHAGGASQPRAHSVRPSRRARARGLAVQHEAHFRSCAACLRCRACCACCGGAAAASRRARPSPCAGCAPGALAVASASRRFGATYQI